MLSFKFNLKLLSWVLLSILSIMILSSSGVVLAVQFASYLSDKISSWLLLVCFCVSFIIYKISLYEITKAATKNLNKEIPEDEPVDRS